MSTLIGIPGGIPGPSAPGTDSLQGDHAYHYPLAGKTAVPMWTDEAQFKTALEEAKKLKIYPPKSPSPGDMQEYEIRAARRRETFSINPYIIKQQPTILSGKEWEI